MTTTTTTMFVIIAIVVSVVMFVLWIGKGRRRGNVMIVASDDGLDRPPVGLPDSVRLRETVTKREQESEA